MAFSMSMFGLLSNSGSPTATLYSFDTDDRSWTTGETLENGTPVGQPPYGLQRRSGPAPNRPDSGPAAGLKGDGYYYYAEASGTRAGSAYALVYDGSACAGVGLVERVSFWFHMYSSRISGAAAADVGTLRVVAGSASPGTDVWLAEGARADQWFYGTARVNAPSFQFIVTRGGDRSDIAVDEVTVECAFPTPPFPPAPQFPPPSSAPTLPPHTPPAAPRPPLTPPRLPPTLPPPAPPHLPPLLPMLCATAELITSPCEDSFSWVDGIGSDCSWYGANDPGCFRYVDRGQLTSCPRACGLCPGICADSAYWLDSGGNGCAWYAAHDPGCRRYGDMGQPVYCPIACQRCCPFLSDGTCEWVWL